MMRRRLGKGKWSDPEGAPAQVNMEPVDDEVERYLPAAERYALYD